MVDADNGKQKLREKIQNEAGCLEEKIHRMSLPEDAKQNIMDDFHYLLNKSREYPEGEKSDFINKQICSFLDIVDSMISEKEAKVEAVLSEASEGDKNSPRVAEERNDNISNSVWKVGTATPEQQHDTASLSEHGLPTHFEQKDWPECGKPDEQYLHCDAYYRAQNREDCCMRKRIQDAAGNLDEKIQRLDISEDAKHSILDNLNYLLTKSRECQGGQSAEFLNGQICSLLDHVDSLSSVDQEEEEGYPAEDHSAVMSTLSGDNTYNTDNTTAPRDAHRQDEDHEPTPPHHNYGREQLLRLMPDDKPDVVLNVPNVSVDRINLEINNLSARVAVDAAVKHDAVRLFVGVDAHLERVKLTIENVQACAQLTVRLDTVRKIVDRALEAIDSDKHPSVLGMTQGLLKR